MEVGGFSGGLLTQSPLGTALRLFVFESDAIADDREESSHVEK